MATRHRIAEVSDLPEDGDRAFAEVEGVEVAVFRIEGSFHALANYCVHQGGPLCEGPLEGEYEVDEEGWWSYDAAGRNVVCPWHGWKFDVETGVSVEDERYAAPTYEVEVEDGTVYVLR